MAPALTLKPRKHFEICFKPGTKPNHWICNLCPQDIAQQESNQIKFNPINGYSNPNSHSEKVHKNSYQKYCNSVVVGLGKIQTELFPMDKRTMNVFGWIDLMSNIIINFVV